jgi:GTP cyclohydrolase I
MVAGSSPPLGPKPKSALPSYLINGDSHPPLSKRARERETLNSSIRSSFAPRREALDSQEIDSGSEEESASRGPSTIQANKNSNHYNSATKYSSSSLSTGENGTLDPEAAAKKPLSEPPRDPRDQAAAITPTVSRPASPYTLNPPIDFDGLSWPCRWLILLPPFLLNRMQLIISCPCET